MATPGKKDREKYPDYLASRFSESVRIPERN
jgi:hypothetical protein